MSCSPDNSRQKRGYVASLRDVSPPPLSDRHDTTRAQHGSHTSRENCDDQDVHKRQKRESPDRPRPRPPTRSSPRRPSSRVSDVSPPPQSERQDTTRARHGSQTGRENCDAQDVFKRQKRKSPDRPRHPTRSSPRRPSRSQGSRSDSQSGRVTRERNTPVKKSPKKREASKKVKPLAETETTNRKGYTSDGMSFESLPDDDLPDINMASPYKGKQYSKDDIVWAPFNNKYVKMHWPAVVTSVKGPHVCYLYINFYEKPVYRLHAKRLIPFDNPSQNLELKEKGLKTAGFKEAYELVINYYCNRKYNTSLSARHFLTHRHSENDKVGLAKTCLFRLTGKLDSEGVEEVEVDVDVEGLEIVNDEELDNEEEVEGDCEDEQKTDSAQSERIKEILEDLETLPSHMTVSSEQVVKMREEAEQLLDFIDSEECFEYLMNIRQGNLSSSRHKKFMNGEEVLGGLGPFTLFNDLSERFFSAIDSHCDDHDSFDYKHHVMIPEALIYGIMKLRKCSRINAKKYFHRTCQKHGIRD